MIGHGLVSFQQL